MNRMAVPLAIAMTALLSAPVTGTKPLFPESWDPLPEDLMMTMDYVPLPGGYGHGSSTIGNYIRQQMRKEKEKAGRISYPPAFGEPPRAQTRDLRKLPFDYGMGSGTMAQWLDDRAQKVYEESAAEYEAHIKDELVEE